MQSKQEFIEGIRARAAYNRGEHIKLVRTPRKEGSYSKPKPIVLDIPEPVDEELAEIEAAK